MNGPQHNAISGYYRRRGFERPLSPLVTGS